MLGTNQYAILTARINLNTYNRVVERESLAKVCISIPHPSPVVLAEDILLFPPLAILGQAQTAFAAQCSDFHCGLVNSVFEALNRIRECIFFYVQPDIANRLQVIYVMGFGISLIRSGFTAKMFLTSVVHAAGGSAFRVMPCFL